MKHYHVMVGPMAGTLPASLTFNEYEESAVAYLSLTRKLFDGRYDEEEMTIEQVLEHTSDSQGIYMGTPSLAVLWVPCDVSPCTHSSWN